MPNKIRLLKDSRQDVIAYFKRSWMLYLMLALPIAFFVIFRYIPMANIVIAFKNYNLIGGPWITNEALVAKGILLDYCNGSPHEPNCGHWVGLDWFMKAFGDGAFWRAVRNTLVLNMLDLVVGFPAPIILALILNELIFQKFKKVTQTIIYLPHFLSWIIVSSMATRLLAPTNGVINVFLVETFSRMCEVHQSMGLANVTNCPDCHVVQPINFLMNNANWIGTYITFGVWKEMGWGTIIYLAAITGINPELYEAAEVDGAGRWRKLWHITLPGIRPTIVVLLIMNIGRILGIEFDRPFTMMNRVVMEVADVISTLVYRVGILNWQYSYTAAVGLFQSIICVVFLIGANTLAKRFGERGIW
ncbi:MAG: ABC transporter permease subunit [Treponema sp.]|nr:ABC transporter permease subunit [Treponema sp.]